MNAARPKGRVLYKWQVMFFPDLPMEVHKQQKHYDSVKQRLRTKAIRHGILYPACLSVSHCDHSYVSDTPAEADNFLVRLGRGVEVEQW